MTGDQYRVRITVTVQEGLHARGRRSSVVERLTDGGPLDSIGAFVREESERLFKAARQEARAEPPELRS